MTLLNARSSYFNWHLNYFHISDFQVKIPSDSHVLWRHMWCLVHSTVTHMRPSPWLQCTGHANHNVWSHDATMTCYLAAPLLTECSRPCYSWYPWTSKPVWSLDIYTKYPPPTPARKLFQHSNVTSSTWHWASTNLIMLESQGDEIILELSNAYKSIYCVGMWVNI